MKSPDCIVTVFLLMYENQIKMMNSNDIHNLNKLI